MLENQAIIELATLEDATEIGRISRSDIEYGLGWNYRPERIVRYIRDISKNVVVARVESRLAGFGIMTYREDQANLDLLAVISDFRRLTVGTQIVQWLEKVAMTAGVSNIFVQVRASNMGAVKFYEGMGFHRLDEKKGYYRGVEAGLIMVKSIRLMFNVP